MRTHKYSSYVLSCTFLGALVVATGCGQSEPAEFRLNMPVLLTNNVMPDHQQQAANVLGALFGTPDEPIVPPESGLDINKLRMAAGPVARLEDGSKQGLYRQHCVHCHGITGDGRGPTALILNPYPRDYRPGVFKAKSTTYSSKPTDDDLLKTLTNGINGTTMPSFKLLPKDELEALIEYVKYLSIRGEVEIQLATYITQGDAMYGEDGETLLELNPLKYPAQKEEILGLVADVVANWQAAPENVVYPEEDGLPSEPRSADEITQSVALGKAIFYGKGECVKCHGQTALGDGQMTDFDYWSLEINKFNVDTVALQKRIDEAEPKTEEDEKQLAAEKALLAQRLEVQATLFPTRNIIPRNLRQGVFRFGRRPIDIYWKVHEGIYGTPMPARPGTVSEAEIWNVVDYVLSLPNEDASKPLEEVDGVLRPRL